MFHSKHTKQIPCLLNLFSPWIFCRFLKFLKNVEPPFTILWNCLHERCFKVHTSFRQETGSTTKVSLFLEVDHVLGWFTLATDQDVVSKGSQPAMWLVESGQRESVDIEEDRGEPWGSPVLVGVQSERHIRCFIMHLLVLNADMTHKTKMPSCSMRSAKMGSWTRL